jgi:hypothetical protein
VTTGFNALDHPKAKLSILSFALTFPVGWLRYLMTAGQMQNSSPVRGFCLLSGLAKD